MLMYYNEIEFNMSYAMWVQSWYHFISLLDVDLKDGMACEKCGDQPDVIICDGTAVGFQKKFLTALVSRPEEIGDNIPRARLIYLFSQYIYFRQYLNFKKYLNLYIDLKQI